MNPIKKMKLSALKRKVKKNQEKREAGNAVNLEQEVSVLLELARFYEDNAYDRDLPNAIFLAQEAYRQAALLGDKEGQYKAGQLFLERGKFWIELLDSELGCEIQKEYAKHCFDEGFKYLTDAHSNGHALAMRLHGMAYVNGWGVPQDLDRGYRMVVNSIDMENAWHNATKIFETLGLNSTSFFSKLGEIKKERGGYE